MGSEISKLFVEPKDIPRDFGGFVQLLYLGATYAFVLCTASGWIGDGSELLLLIPAFAGVVGSVVLPVLGAVPDGAIILFSGLGDDAQAQLSIGIGALAGSTVMLLTVPWALSVFAGRVVLNPDGTGRYKDKPKLPNPSAIAGTGVNCDTEAVGNAAKWMMATALPIIIVQGAAFGDKCSAKPSGNATAPVGCDDSNERTFALIALCLATIGFIGYLVNQVRLGGNDTAKIDKIEQLRKNALLTGQLTLRGIFKVGEGTNVSKDDKEFRSVVTTFFKRYDVDGNGSMDVQELSNLMRDLGENVTGNDLKALAKEMDTDSSGVVELDEFIAAMTNLVNSGHVTEGRIIPEVTTTPAPVGHAEEGDGDDSEEEEMPEDLADLSPEEQRKKLLQRAFIGMFSGTFVVLLFSDPTVDILSELGDRIGVNPFYISFILCPLASNASEIIASYGYAGKKTTKTMTVALSVLLGASVMNNTFCLMIFLILIVAKKLVWVFSAETICILFVEMCMFFFARRTFHPTWTAGVVLALLPLSLLLVVGLESAGLN